MGLPKSGNVYTLRTDVIPPLDYLYMNINELYKSSIVYIIEMNEWKWSIVNSTTPWFALFMCSL